MQIQTTMLGLGIAVLFSAAGCVGTGRSGRLPDAPNETEQAYASELPLTGLWGATEKETVLGPLVLEGGIAVISSTSGSPLDQVGFGLMAAANLGVGELGGVGLRMGYNQMEISNANGQQIGIPIEAFFFGHYRLLNDVDGTWDAYGGILLGYRIDDTNGSTLTSTFEYDDAVTIGFAIGTRWYPVDDHAFVSLEFGFSTAIDATLILTTGGGTSASNAGSELDYIWLRLGGGFRF